MEACFKKKKQMQIRVKILQKDVFENTETNTFQILFNLFRSEFSCVLW